MFRFLFIFTLILVEFNGFSQNLKGVIIDQYDQTLENVTVLNKSRNSGTTSNQKGEFIIAAIDGDLIVFSYIGKKTFYYTAKTNDTNFILITLKEDLTKLKEFSISGSRIKKVSTEIHDNVLDYYSLGYNTLLVLKRTNKKYVLSIEGVDTAYKIFPLLNLNPTSLFKDCFGNIHVICSDSVRQIHFDSNLTIISTISKRQFDTFIKPVVYNNDSSLFVFNYGSQNKKYTLIKENRNSKSIVYNSFDSIFSDYIDKFIRFNMGGAKINPAAAPQDSQLRNGRDSFQANSFFNKILCKKLFVTSFEVNNTLLLFDLFLDSLHTFNENGGKIKSISLKTIKDLNPKKIIQNQETPSLFYALTEKEGIYSLHQINLLTGQISMTFTLSEFNFPTNIKVIDNWVYFLRPNKTGRKGIYRIDIDQ